MRDKSVVVMLDPCSYTPFYTYNLISCLADQGWPVRWITSDFIFESLPDARHVPITPFFFSWFPANRLLSVQPFAHNDCLRGLVKMALYPLEMARFSIYLKSLPPGILHVQWANLPFLDRTLWQGWKRMGWKLVYTAHDPVPLEGTTPHPFFSAGRDLLMHADAILVHSRKGRLKLIQQGLNPGKIHEIQMGPTLLAETDPVPQDAARRELGIPANSPTILFFGFIKPYKGLDLLLESMSAIQDAFPESRLVVAGKLMEPFSQYNDILEKLPSRSSIIWNLDFIPTCRMSVYFSAADVVVAPYRQGSSSSVIDLAHYFNKPVVATDVGGLSEQVHTGYGDCIVPPDSPALLAEAVIHVLNQNQRQSDQSNPTVPPTGRIASTWSAIAANHGRLYNSLQHAS
ncbi:MAG: glycosyltransferase family 4 protein [Pseudomonadota bacterium]